jgi:NCS1 family nucleobase:cation symporter-1
MCPWNLLKSSNNFTSYLSAYSVFLSSIAGVMVRIILQARFAVLVFVTLTGTLVLGQVTEYYVIRRGHYNVADLYRTSQDTWYWYTYGVNFR